MKQAIKGKGFKLKLTRARPLNGRARASQIVKSTINLERARYPARLAILAHLPVANVVDVVGPFFRCSSSVSGKSNPLTPMTMAPTLRPRSHCGLGFS